MRKLFFLIVSVSLIFNLSAQDNKIIDEVIWIVGDEAIFKSEVEQEIMRARYEGTKIEGNPYCVIPEQIAIQKLFLHQAALDSLNVSETSVNAEVDARVNYYIANIGSKEKVEEYFRKPMNELREELRTMVKNNNLIMMSRENLVKDIQVTPSEVRRYFNSIPADSVPTIPAQVELQILSVTPPIPQSEINRVKDKLREFTERINANPNDFSLLARLYSEDPGSAKQGGEIGFLGRGQLDPAYASAAFNLNDSKKVSRIVESEFGFHIIQLIEKRGDKVNTRHILLKPHISLEDKVNGMKKLDSIADLIRENKISFEQAVANYSQDKNTVMNAGLMNNSETGTSKFEYQQLPAEVAKVVYDMNVGEVSKAFIMMDKNTNKEMLAIVKLKSKTPNHKANVMDDYQTLKNILENKKKQDFLNNWITQKQKETYISISPEWRNCDFQYKGWIK
ncbi:PpiC-type peptidyl-prolyl cis-trans isomerase [uncultured Paludibacter sp.]|nr:PpiC-type peptidyl-prolyl cis-trans isomerase [uncultured Paludibacter sp.]